MSFQIGSRIRIAMCSIGVLCCGVSSPVPAQFSMDVGVPSAVIGLHIQHFPNLVPVPRYPVYYARDLASNLFFYDGHYWAYSQDNWYRSRWYDGPWDFVPPETVPDSILRIPLLYYRQPPPYFAGWDRRSPPHWGERWGRGWEDRRRGWDHWDRNEVPRRAPPPVYWRRDPSENYPLADERGTLRGRNSFYEPREDWERHRSDWLRSGATEPNHAKEPNREPAARPRPEVPPRNVSARPPQTPNAAPGHLIPRHGNPQLPEGRPEHAKPPADHSMPRRTGPG